MATGGLVRHGLAAVESMLSGAATMPASGTSVWAVGPLVIVGPSGSGKSRLLAEWFLAHSTRSGARATLWDGLSLGREIATALGRDRIDRLHETFVSSRLVVIDGIEAIVPWDVQRALAHLLDAASAEGTILVVAMRTHPSACRGMEPSLASRLAGGLVAVMPSGRAIGGKHPADASAAGRNPSLRRIIGVTARRQGLDAADMVGPSRARRIAHARALAMYLARMLTCQSLQAIGRAFGGRDHTTVLHGIRVTQERRSSDPGLAAEIDALVEMLT